MSKLVLAILFQAIASVFAFFQLQGHYVWTNINFLKSMQFEQFVREDGPKSHYKKTGIIANPNCSTIQMLVAIKPIHDLCKVIRINVCTYQAVSGTGNNAIKELNDQVNAYVNNNEILCDVYPKQIAFNVIPQIDNFMENGYTKEEMKMVWETKKILDEKIEVNPSRPEKLVTIRGVGYRFDG